MVKMSDSSFEQLKEVYYRLSDYYFDIPESETTQADRDNLLDACKSIEEVLFAHETPSRGFE